MKATGYAYDLGDGASKLMVASLALQKRKSTPKITSLMLMARCYLTL